MAFKITYRLDKKKADKKIESLIRGIKDQRVHQKAGSELKKRIIQQASRGRGVRKRKEVKLEPLSPSTVKRRARMGFGRSRVARLNMSGRLLRSIRRGMKRNSFELSISGEQATIVRALAAGRYYSQSGRRMAKRVFFSLNRRRLNVLMKTVYRPWIERVVRR